MTKTEFISTITHKAKITPAAAARVADAIFDADGGAILEAFRHSGVLDDAGEKPSTVKRRRRRSRRRSGAEGLTEEQIRAKLIAGFLAVQGMEIEDVFGRLG